ncbi:MAG: hypothetical protein BRC29_05080 [Nanohaloarchaea archaeon SW_7_43_1]|nr:MAG: hypothetical protein BRC29_05080 [Nanohaloarchaea archaeon SW_7_43_1]
MGTAAGLTWENPSEDGEIFDSNNIILNVSEGDDSYVDFWVKGEQEANYTLGDNVTDEYKGYYNYTLDEEGDGTYDILANNSANEENRTGIIFDSQTPNLDDNSPTGITGDSPTVDIQVSDTGDSGVNYSYINVTDPGGNDVDSKKGTSLSLSGLNSGDYTVDYTIVDNAGNTESGSWSFTVDTSYDGDENPSVDIEGEDNSVVDYDEDTDIDVDFGSADSTSDTTATCVVGGDDIDSNTFNSASSGSNELTCTLDDSDDDYYDTTATVKVEIEDEAGNSKTYEYGDVAFDAEKPTVSELDSSTGLNTFNDNFDVEYSAFDDASSVDGAEYYFDVGTNTGDGTSVSDGDFTADLSDLESGSHTLYIRAQDEASRWSSTETFNFEYYPDRDPEVSLTVPTSVNVTSGESTEFDVSLENTGDFYIEAVNLNIESDLISENETVSGLEPGDSITKGFEVETSEEDIGEYSVDVSTKGPESSEDFDLRVEANEDQQQDIESTLSEYEEKLESLQANVSELEGSISEEQSKELSSNMSDFKSNVEGAREAVEAGEYYKANSDLSSVDSDFSKAKTTYENVRDDYQSSRRLKMILGGFAALIFVGLGSIFVLNREDIIDVDEHIEKLEETADDTDAEGIDLGAIKEKLSEILNNDPDAEEFEWDGFKD